MENITTQAIAIADEDWKADREEALNCPSFGLESLIDRVLDRWKSASIGYQALADAQTDRARSLSLARSLRVAEQTIFAVVSAAFPAIREGYYVRRIDDLMFALLRCRMLIVLPTARRMAERDGMGRSAEAIAFLLAKEAQFIGGRAVINQALASEMPSPYKTEAANT
jgi:hypothetical protein